VGSVLRVSPDDLATDRPLSELGLDSLVAIDLVMRLESAFDISVATGRVNSKMTIEDLAAMVVSLLTGRSTAPARSAADPEAPTDCLVNLRSAGDDAPLFLIHPGGGEVSVYSDLVAALPLGRPVIAVESRTLVGRHDEFERLSDMIASYAEMIASRQPEGPLHLAGFSFGGHAAFAIAKALELQGRTVAAIGVLDSDVRLISSNLTAADRLKMSLDELSEWAAFQGLFTIHSGAAITNEDHLAELVSLPEAELVDWLMATLQAAGRFNLRLPEVLLRRKIALRVRHIRLLETHAPLPVAGSLLVVSSRMTLCEDSYWRALTTSELRTIKIDCMHFDLLAPPAVGHVSSALAQLLDSVNTSRQRNTLTETAME
jgi:thioesterase domain-containing protein/acyl carrier protein